MKMPRPYMRFFKGEYMNQVKMPYSHIINCHKALTQFAFCNICLTHAPL